MTDHIIKSWNAQADALNQWATLGEDEKLAWAYQQGMERAAEICDQLAGVTSKWPEASEGLTAETKFVRGVGDCMATFGEQIRVEAHANNQPKNVHDGSVV